MELKILENRKNKLKMDVEGETHTLLNLLRERSWEAKADQAAYIIEHPTLSSLKITVTSDNPKKTLTSASQMVIDDAKEFQKEFKRAMKK